MLALMLVAPSVFAASAWPATTDVEIGAGVVAEPSGAVVHNNQLWVVSDNGYLAAMNFDGTEQRTWYLGGDLEAIATPDTEGDILMIGVENPDSIYEFNTASESLTGNSWSLTSYMTGSDNAGLEALTYANGLYYAGLQATGEVFVFDLLDAGSVSHVATIASPAGLSDFSGAHFDGEHFYFVYDSSSYLGVYTVDSYQTPSTFAFVEDYQLAGDSQEGIALSGSAIYIAEDSGEIWSYDGFIVAEEETAEETEEVVEEEEVIEEEIEETEEVVEEEEVIEEEIEETEEVVPDYTTIDSHVFDTANEVIEVWHASGDMYTIDYRANKRTRVVYLESNTMIAVLNGRFLRVFKEGELIYERWLPRRR